MSCESKINVSYGSLSHILNWIEKKNNEASVSIKKVAIDDCVGWSYNEQTGNICNSNSSFFQISGIKQCTQNVIIEQPIIIQNEIGYLGIIRKKINGTYYYLMQAKIEPGNINYIQISPTIQATKSNFTQKHGGKRPAYLEYFLNTGSENIVVDQIQSEQSSRFFKKRNRNIIIEIDEDKEIEILPSHMWMTLLQIKELMKYDNLVNMDTRTVLSCIPYYFMDDMVFSFNEKHQTLHNSIKKQPDIKTIVDIYRKINNYKMFNQDKIELCDLFSLKKWNMENNEFLCKESYPFKIIFCDISIEGREVKHWCQPLFEAMGKATFGLLSCDDGDIMKFLVKLTPEIGCFDQVEIGPTIQREAIHADDEDVVSKLFFNKLEKGKGIIFDTMLSEEGGRFYHEENRNIIININKKELKELPDNYVWSDYATLNMLTQINNCLNIQLRNLLAVLEF